MRQFSDALNAALAAPVIRPVWLLEIVLRSAGGGERTLRLADRPYTLWGADWAPLVLGWGPVDRYFDPSGGEIKVSDAAVELSNKPGALGPGEGNVSRLFREYDLAASTATLYLWLDGAGLAEPSAGALNDLLPVLTGRPEISMEITPFVCPLDIVAREGEWAGGDCPWGDLLQGRYTRRQWGGLPKDIVGKWKPAVFGDDVLVEGLPLAGPARAGVVEGPAGLFDPAAGAATLAVRFPESGDSSQAAPYPAPFDLYIGDWRLTVTRAPTMTQDGAWEYPLGAPGGAGLFYVPTPLTGASPLFAPAPGRLWPRSDESGEGPYAASEPATGSPWQFYHGALDTGSPKDGFHPGRGGFISKVFADGVELSGDEVVKDHGFGIAWIRRGGAARGKAGNPSLLRVKWTAVDEVFSTGADHLRPWQLTARYPHGHNAEERPCILGDFAVPASGGGAPVSTRLGLVMSPAYPPIGSRLAAARLVVTYTGLDMSSDVSQGRLNLEFLGGSDSFPMSELGDGAGIEPSGWTVVRGRKGAEFEVWPGNSGYPYTQTSPDPRHGGEITLYRDVTDLVAARIDSEGAITGDFRAWVSGTVWPDTNSLILLGVELELEYDPVETIIEGAEVTALVSGPGSTAGEIMASLIPAEELGDGYDDPSLPRLKYRSGRQMTVCDFLGEAAREAGVEMKRNFITGKWDLVKKAPVRDPLSPPPAQGGEAVVTQDELLADPFGLPMIRRTRSAPETVINEITVSYTDETGRRGEVTMRDQGSVDVHGLRRREASLSAAMTRQEAEDYALAVLNDHASMADYYTMTFPLGKKLALEPNDVIEVTAQMDGLDKTRMRVVSVEIDPGSLDGGELGAVTVHAMRYRRVRSGAGSAPFGQAPYGGGQVMEN